MHHAILPYRKKVLHGALLVCCLFAELGSYERNVSMTDRSKEILVAELPVTEQGRIDYYFHAKRQMKEAHKIIDKMDYLCGYLEESLKDCLLNAISQKDRK